MKKLFFTIVFSGLIALNLFAQEVPQSFTYQAIARNADGTLIANEEVSIRITIVEDSPTGFPVYSETHDRTTNKFGLFTLEIGSGNTGDDFLAIDWENHSHFIQTEFDSGSGVDLIGSAQILSVPYALLAQRAIEDETEDSDPDPTNELQDLELIGDVLQITGNPDATPINMSPFIGTDTDDQELTYDPVTNILTLEDGGFANLSNLEDDDPDPTNELQDLELIGDVLQITGNPDATPINLSPFIGTDTDDQGLTYDPVTNILTLEDGGFANLSDLEDEDPDPTNEIQGLQLNGNTLSIVNGGGFPSISLPAAASLWEEGPGFIYHDGGDVLVRNSLGLAVVGLGRWDTNIEKGVIQIYDNNNIRVEAGVSPLTSGGYSVVFGPNGNENGILGTLVGFPDHGFISVTGSDGLSPTLVPEAGMLVDPFGNGMIQVNGPDAWNGPGTIGIDPSVGSYLSANIKFFVMTHPTDATKEITYACLEGPEAAAYERGTTKLENGEAWVPFSEHFELVINPETMTVNLTPNSANTMGLAVVEKTSTGIRVKELMNGAGNFEFDWEAKAVRKGYEDLPVIRDKRQLQATMAIDPK